MKRGPIWTLFTKLAAELSHLGRPVRIRVYRVCLDVPASQYGVSGNACFRSSGWVRWLRRRGLGGGGCGSSRVSLNLWMSHPGVDPEAPSSLLTTPPMPAYRASVCPYRVPVPRRESRRGPVATHTDHEKKEPTP